MADNRLFRSALFGGYNKEDVDEYIKSMEHEIESIKVLHQREKNELMKKLEGQQQNEAQVPAQTEETGRMEIQILKEETEKLRKENEDLKLKLKAEQEKTIGWEENTATENTTTENTAAKNDDLFDYATVSKIMEEARKSGEQIIAESRKKAEKIMEEAGKDADEQKKRIERRINAQLEEKGIQLIAAKYKIQQYAKEIESAQQGLCDLNSRIREMAENMPVRLDNYWEGEHYRSLESGMRRDKIQQRIEERETQEDA